MSFWDVTKRILQGKPAFETPTDRDDWDDDAPTIDFSEERTAKLAEKKDETELYDSSGHKQIPVVSLESPNPVPNGDLIDIWVTIKNQSSRDITVEKVTLFGTRTELHIPLAPKQERELRIYRGKELTHNHYSKAELYYKDVLSGDYFRADHLIDYKYDGDKTYDVSDFELLMPINDI